MGVGVTSHVNPPSREWKICAAEPPAPNQASRPADVTIDPLSAKPYSSGGTGGMPALGSIVEGNYQSTPYQPIYDQLWVK